MLKSLIKIYRYFDGLESIEVPVLDHLKVLEFTTRSSIAPGLNKMLFYGRYVGHLIID